VPSVAGVGPAGPYVDSGEVLTADLDFAIDPDVRLRPDGTAVLTFATDYVDEQPYGTGLAEAPLDAELRRITGPVIAASIANRRFLRPPQRGAAELAAAVQHLATDCAVSGFA